MADNKIRLLVLFGGVSGEHEVSLISAGNVISAVNRDRYDVLPVFISKQGEWFTAPDPKPLLAGDTTNAYMVCLPADPTIKRLCSLDGKTLPQELSKSIDCAFPVLHGPNGEDGTIQGLLTLANIPFVGAGVLSSALIMDKGYTKLVFQHADLPTLPYLVYNYHDWRKDQPSIISQIEKELHYPVFTKPCNLGSSVGISKAKSRKELDLGLTEAFRYDNRVIVEQGVSARELECAVLGNLEPKCSILGEIVPANEFYDYNAKYIDDNSELLVPAPVDDELTQLAQGISIRAFLATNCRGMVRVDYLLDKETDKLYLNEINTIPGFTAISMYPKLWQASGLSYPQLIDELVRLALEEQGARDRLKKSYR